LAAERERGKMKMDPQAFPSESRFKAIRSYPIVARPTLIT
jgi:hypothetical protein